MWHLGPFEEFGLIISSAAMLASCTVLLICWVMTNQHNKRKVVEFEPSNKKFPYGTGVLSSVNLTKFSLDEIPEEGGFADQTKPRSLRGSIETLVSDGFLVSRLSASDHRAHQNLAPSLSSGSESKVDKLFNRQDSSYSSMSSERDSPSIFRSSTKRSVCREKETDKNENTECVVPVVCPSPVLNLSLHLAYPQSSETRNVAAGTLTITIHSVTDIPSREYRAHCDPWVNISVIRERRSLRRRPPTEISRFQTKTIRHAHNPYFDQIFYASIPKNEVKDMVLKFSVMDQDRYTGSREIAVASLNLKEAKQTVQVPEMMTLSLPLAPPKTNKGEIMFGMSYLPTAQRLSINLIKATNLRLPSSDHQKTEKKPNPYVKMLMFNPTGRLIKKKKSSIKFDIENPEFDETINVEAEPWQLESHSIVLILLSKLEKESDIDEMCEGIIGVDIDSSDQESYYRFNMSSLEKRYENSKGRAKDPVLGVLFLGKSVKGEKERDQWQKVMNSPRKVFTFTHTLK